MRKLLHKFWPILICLMLASLVAWPMIMPGYFSHHDDLQVMRIFEMRKCLVDHQIPCRWVPDMGYGNGYPLFNYYAVFPYYIGALFSFLLGFLSSAKLLFAIPLFLGAVSMYFLASELFGVYPGILASVLYTYAPYRALDLYVRGDVTESFAMAIIPLTFYFALKLIRLGNFKFLIGLSLSLAAFLTSHNIMSMLFIPVFLLLIFYWLIFESRKYIRRLLSGLLIGTGLSAFFILPAYFEKNLVQIDNLIRLDLNFRAHFADINQLFFNRSWGYGASVPGPLDTISFQIGWPHWWIVVFAVLVFLFGLRLKSKINFLPVILLTIFLFSIFMTHIQSSFIWEKIDILKFTQFPWRFLAVSIFAASLLGGYIVQNLKYAKYMALVLVVVTVALNWSYFRPKEFYFDMTDRQKLSGFQWDRQQKASILDYLPIGAKEPLEPAPDKPIIKAGEADIRSFEKKSNSFNLDVNIKSDAKIEIPVMDFPNWKVYENKTEIKHTNDDYVRRISLDLPVGTHAISGKLINTPIRTAGNIISFLSLLIIGYLTCYGKIRRSFK